MDATFVNGDGGGLAGGKSSRAYVLALQTNDDDDDDDDASLGCFFLLRGLWFENLVLGGVTELLFFF